MSVNVENMRKWVAALRSGEFKQTKNRLRNQINLAGEPVEFGYCCLGVATELALQDGVDEIECEYGGLDADPNHTAHEGWCSVWGSGTLGTGARGWLGVNSRNPFLNGSDGVPYVASHWNDDAGADFPAIADMIENTYPEIKLTEEITVG